MQAGQVRPSIRLGFHQMLAVQELRGTRIGPTLLTNHIGTGALAHRRFKVIIAKFEASALEAQLQGIGHHRLVQGRLVTQASVRDGL